MLAGCLRGFVFLDQLATCDDPELLRPYRAASQRRLVAIAGSLREWPPSQTTAFTCEALHRYTADRVSIEGGPEAAAHTAIAKLRAFMDALR
jgi:hypothetical protein